LPYLRFGFVLVFMLSPLVCEKSTDPAPGTPR
jgi:hypothetical protein